MKPSWEDAPEWANWLAKDSNGTWNWFETIPALMMERRDSYFWSTSSRWEEATTAQDIYFADSLEKRP